MSSLSKNWGGGKINKEQIIENIKKKIDEFKEIIKTNKLNNTKREEYTESYEFDMCYFDSKLFSDSFKVIDDEYDILITQLKMIMVFYNAVDSENPIAYYYEIGNAWDGEFKMYVEASTDFMYLFNVLVNADLYDNGIKLNLFVPTNGLNLLNNLTPDEHPFDVILSYASERINFKLKDCTLLEYIQSMEQNKNNNQLPNNMTSNNFTNINKNLKQINRKLDKIMSKNTK